MKIAELEKNLAVAQAAKEEAINDKDTSVRRVGTSFLFRLFHLPFVHSLDARLQTEATFANKISKVTQETEGAMKQVCQRSFVDFLSFFLFLIFVDAYLILLLLKTDAERDRGS